MKILIGLLPVILFLVFLLFIDSFKLVKLKTIVLCVFWGISATWLAFFINTWLYGYLQEMSDTYSKYVAPYVEEFLKMLLIIVLVRKNKIGFPIDGAIYGFAIGTGFALMENIIYMYQLNFDNTMTWIVRGFGTAIMHGGATSILVLFVMINCQKSQSLLQGYLAGLFVAILLHSFYNQFLFSPFTSTIIMILVMPVMLSVIFQNHEKELKKWLFEEFDSEMNLLMQMKHGTFKETNPGKYIMKIKSKFSNLIVLDMINYISLYAELSLKAKRNMMLKEQKFPLPQEPEIQNKLEELKALSKEIGTVGMMALSPILKTSKKDLWKLNQNK